jgi:hypothetical protein
VTGTSRADGIPARCQLVWSQGDSANFSKQEIFEVPDVFLVAERGVWGHRVPLILQYGLRLPRFSFAVPSSYQQLFRSSTAAPIQLTPNTSKFIKNICLSFSALCDTVR